MFSTVEENHKHCGDDTKTACGFPRHYWKAPTVLYRRFQGRFDEKKGKCEKWEETGREGTGHIWIGTDLLWFNNTTESESTLPISKRSDAQSICATEKFILINKINIGYWHQALVRVFVEVKSRLLQPLKVRRGLHVNSYLNKNKKFW